MAVKFRLFLIFTFVLVAIFSSGLISCSEPMKTKQEETSRFNVVISSKSVNLEARSFSTEIQAWLSLPYSYSKIECRIENYFYRTEGDHTDQIDGGQANLTLFETQVDYYEGNVSAVFRLFGLKEFYPLDSYLLNLTFTLPNFGLITENNTDFIMYLGEDYGWGSVHFDVIWDGEMAIISTHLEFIRGSGTSATASLMSVLICSFCLLGSTTLIRPERLEYRLTICLTLFIFSISYSSTMKVDGLSLGEAIINGLLFGTGLFAVVSIIEKALIEVNPRLSVSHYVLDGGFLIMTATSLTAAGSLGLLADRLKAYPWQASPTVVSLLSGILAIPLLYAYIPKTSIFVVHSLWKNRVRIKQRVKSSRLFGRESKSS
jgi:hypothetical protein